MVTLARIKQIWKDVKPTYLSDIERIKQEKDSGLSVIVRFSDLKLMYEGERPIREALQKYSKEELAALTDVMYFGRDDAGRWSPGQVKYSKGTIGDRIEKDPNFGINKYFPLLEKSSSRVVEYMESALKVLF